MKAESKWVPLINAANLVNSNFVLWDLRGIYQYETLVTEQLELGRNWTCDLYISPERFGSANARTGKWGEGEF